MTDLDLAFASIRQGELTPDEGWGMLSPLFDDLDMKTAERLCDALRTWTWKALDRRRRDDALRGWVDVLNRVEAFLSERFARLAAKMEVLIDLLHESLFVAGTLDAEKLLGRRHVEPILRLLASNPGSWMDRSVLMEDIGLRPANTTRLMSSLVDAGWAEQHNSGREARYRASIQGLERARSMAEDVVGEGFDEDQSHTRDQLKELIRSVISRHSVVTTSKRWRYRDFPEKTVEKTFAEPLTFHVGWSHKADADHDIQYKYAIASPDAPPQSVRAA